MTPERRAIRATCDACGSKAVDGINTQAHTQPGGLSDFEYRTFYFCKRCHAAFIRGDWATLAGFKQETLAI